MKIRIDIPHHPYDIQIEKGCLAQAGQWSVSYTHLTLPTTR